MPLYYSGYDMHVESYAEDGERWRDEKVESIYLCHIDNKIVICEYADASKRPKEILHGRRLLCYVEQLVLDSSYTYIYKKNVRKHRIFNWNSRDIFVVYD